MSADVDGDGNPDVDVRYDGMVINKGIFQLRLSVEPEEQAAPLQEDVPEPSTPTELTEDEEEAEPTAELDIEEGSSILVLILVLAVVVAIVFVALIAIRKRDHKKH